MGSLDVSCADTGAGSTEASPCTAPPRRLSGIEAVRAAVVRRRSTSREGKRSSGSQISSGKLLLEARYFNRSPEDPRHRPTDVRSMAARGSPESRESEQVQQVGSIPEEPVAITRATHQLLQQQSNYNCEGLAVQRKLWGQENPKFNSQPTQPEASYFGWNRDERPAPAPTPVPAPMAAAASGMLDYSMCLAAFDATLGGVHGQKFHASVATSSVTPDTWAGMQPSEAACLGQDADHVWSRVIQHQAYRIEELEKRNVLLRARADFASRFNQSRNGGASGSKLSLLQLSCWVEEQKKIIDFLSQEVAPPQVDIPESFRERQRMTKDQLSVAVAEDKTEHVRMSETHADAMMLLDADDGPGGLLGTSGSARWAMRWRALIDKDAIAVTEALLLSREFMRRPHSWDHPS